MHVSIWCTYCEIQPTCCQRRWECPQVASTQEFDFTHPQWVYVAWEWVNFLVPGLTSRLVNMSPRTAPRFPPARIKFAVPRPLRRNIRSQRCLKTACSSFVQLAANQYGYKAEEEGQSDSLVVKQTAGAASLDGGGRLVIGRGRRHDQWMGPCIPPSLCGQAGGRGGRRRRRVLSVCYTQG